MTEFVETQLIPLASALSLCWREGVSICCPVYTRKVRPLHIELMYSVYCMLLCTVAASSVHSLFVVCIYSVIVASWFFPLGNLCLFFIWSTIETFHSL